MNSLVDQLKEERDFLTLELKVRIDPLNDTQNSPYNEYLSAQIEEINTTIYDIITRHRQN